MLLTEIAEALTDYLNENRAKWTEDTDLTVTTELDPMACTTESFSVHIIPNYVQYNIEQDRARGRRTSNNTISLCSLIVAVRFLEIPTGISVTNWSESKKMLDTWQRAQEVLMTFSSTALSLASMETRNPEELEMDMRNFVAMTTFGYSQLSCGSEHESNSPSTGLTGDTLPRGIGASIRSLR